MGQERPVLGVVALGNVTGAVTIDASRGNVFTATLVGNITIGVANVKPGHQIVVQLTQSGSGFTVAWTGGPQTVNAALASDLTPALSGTSVFSLIGSAVAMSTVLLFSNVVDDPGIIELTPNGTDDTSAIVAVMQAHKRARLGPVGATFKVDGTATGTLDWLDLELLDGVRIEPTAGWAPAVGSVSDTTNAFFRIAGSAVAGGFSSAVTSQIAKGTRSVQGVTSTTGLAANMSLRLTATTRAGTVLQETQIVTVATVVDATKFTTTAGVAMWLGPYGQSSSNLPGAFAQITPVSHVRIVAGDGAAFDTLTKNIAVAVRIEDADFRGAGGLGHLQCGFKGFSRAAIYLKTVHDIDCRGLYCEGGNNSLIEGWSVHTGSFVGARTDPAGTLVHAQGVTHPLFYFLEAPTDLWFDDNVIDGRVGMFHVQGGIAGFLGGTNVCRNMNPEPRFTRDPLTTTAFAFGVAFDGDAGPTTQAEFAYDYELGTMYCYDSYTDSVPASAYVGAHAYFLHDMVQCNFERLVCNNEGLDYTPGAIAGIRYWPIGGVVFQEWDNSHGNSIELRNCPYSLTFPVASPLSTIDNVSIFGALNTASSSLNFGFSINTTGNKGLPRFGDVLMSSAVFAMTSTFLTSPDYEFSIRRLTVANVGTWPNVVYADATAGLAAMAATEVCKLDPTAAAGKRRVAAAAAGDPSPVVCAVGTELSLSSTGKLISLGGDLGSTLCINAVAAGDRITADGAAVGANHGCRGITDAAPTVINLLGTALTSQSATGVLMVR